MRFLVIAITAGVRSGLEVAAGARESAPRDVVVNLALSAAAVLVLVIAYVLARRRAQADGASDGA